MMFLFLGLYVNYTFLVNYLCSFWNIFQLFAFLLGFWNSLHNLGMSPLPDTDLSNTFVLFLGLYLYWIIDVF